ncbi:hypothetical protein EMCRGX_G034090 [Ephydatia muelleri]
MAQPNFSPKSLSDVTQEQVKEIAAYLDQGPSHRELDQGPLLELVDLDGNDSISDEYWRKLIKRLAKLDKKYTNLLDKSYIRSLEKEAWELKSPSLKLLANLQSRGIQLEMFRSCLEHKEVHCVNALEVLKNGILVASASTGGVGQHWWHQPALVVSASTGGVNQHWWHRPTLVVSASIGGVNQHWWHRPALVVSASTGGVSQHWWHQPALVVSASTGGVNQHWWHRPALVVSSSTGGIGQHWWHQPALVVSVSTGGVNQHWWHRPSLVASASTSGVGQHWWCQPALVASASTGGVNQHWWHQPALVVSTSTGGISQHWWCQPALVVSTSTGGISQHWWCRPALVVSTSTGGIGQHWWCRPALVVSASIGGVNQHWWHRPALVVSASTGGVSQHWWHQPALVVSASTGGVNQHWWHQPVLVASASTGGVNQHWWHQPALVASASTGGIGQHWWCQPALVASASTGGISQYWWHRPALVVSTSTGGISQHWWHQPVLVASASTGGIGQHWWCQPALVASASTGGISQYWWHQPVLVASASTGGVNQHWWYQPVLVVSSSTGGISQHWWCQPALVASASTAQSPTIVTQPENCDLDVGTELKLHCKAQCTYPLQYQWFKGREPLVKSNNSTYSVQRVELSDTGQYTCRVRNPTIGDPKKAFVFSRTVQVTVHPPPRAPIQETAHSIEPVVEVVITTQPKPVNTQYGSDAIFSCRAEGLPGQVITYEWYKGEEKVPSGNSAVLCIPTVTCEDEGQYHCVASCGSRKPVISDRIKLHVELNEADHIEITEHPQAEIEARVNETITLKCRAHNTSGKELDYQWFKENNKKVTGATGSEYKLQKCKRHIVKCKYYCRVSLKNCSGIFVKSKCAEVTVNMLWFIMEPRDFDGYVNEPVILYCQAEGLPGKKISYLWLKSSTPGGKLNSLPVCGDTLIIQSLRDSDCGYYTCQASEDSQFISSCPVSVTAKLRDGNEEKKPPVIRFIKQPRSWAVEVGKPFSLVCKAVASSGGVSYQWYKDGHVQPDQQSERLDRTATLDSFGSYYCVVKTTNAYGCDLSEAARVSLSIGDPVQNAQVHDAEKCYRIKEEEHFAQEKVALLIGNGDYNEMETLKAVESDIKNLHATLADKLGFKVISLMDLKYHEMMKALKQFYKYLQSGVYALFYFSGHGFNCNNTTYLMPIDARKDSLNCNECISSRTIKFHIQEKCAIGIALLDCCQVSGGRVVSTSPADAPVGFNYSTYLEISACHDGFVAFADANGSIFNKALIPCLERKVKVNMLDLEIDKEMRKMSQNSQRPDRKGTILHKDMTLHDPIMLSNGDAEKNIDSLSQQYSMANSVPGPIRLNVEVEPCVQLELSFSAQFSNVLHVRIRPLAGNNISVTSVVIDKEFMKSQGVIASSDEVSGGIFSFKIKSIQGAAWPLKLNMKVTVSIGGQEQCIHCVHQFEEKFMFASLT